MGEEDAGEGISWMLELGSRIYGKMQSDLCALGTFENMSTITFVVTGTGETLDVVG